MVIELRRNAGRAAVAGLVVAVFSGPALADTTEPPLVVEPPARFAAQARGANATLGAPVQTDGFQNVYRVTTADGAFRIRGNHFLAMRLNEIRAAERLKAVQSTAVFSESFQKSLTAPLDFAADAVTDPGGTIKRTVDGFGRLIDRTTSGIRNAGRVRGNVAENIIGVDRAKRELAFALGVSPYSDYAPLQAGLDRVGRAAALGGLTIRGAIALIPGGAGIAVAAVSTTGEVASLLRDKTPSQLYDINRDKLIRAVGRSQSVDLFLDNPHYTTGDQTAMADALFVVRGADNVAAFFSQAATAVSRDEAVLARVRARLFADYHKRVAGIAGFSRIGGTSLFRDQRGLVIALFPHDTLSWSDQVRSHVLALSAAHEGGRQSEFWITGTASDLARANLAANGWRLFEKVDGAP